MDREILGSIEVRRVCSLKFIIMSKHLLIMSVSDKVLAELTPSVLVFPTLSEAFPQMRGKSKVTGHSLLHNVPGPSWKSEGKSISRID